jgi:hypothetical protein
MGIRQRRPRQENPQRNKLNQNDDSAADARRPSARSKEKAHFSFQVVAADGFP